MLTPSDFGSILTRYKEWTTWFFKRVSFPARCLAEHFYQFPWEGQHCVLLREMMFCWKREAVSNLPLSFGGKSVSRDEVFACECAASPSEGQSQQLTVIAPAGVLHQMNFGSFPSHVLTTLLSFFSAVWRVGSQRATSDLFGARAHRGIQTKSAPRFCAALK